MAVFNASKSILAEDSTSKVEEYFEMRIRPVLVENCYTCHTNLQMGGLRLDSQERLLKGGNSGPAVIPGKPAESLLIQAVNHSHARIKMPPQGKLKDQQIADLANWVKMGVPWPENRTAFSTVATSKEETATPARSSFWAFQPIRKPALPKVKSNLGIKSPIDHFTLSRLESEGLQPVKAATKQALLRRATYDLIGLPPRPEEVDAFLLDSSPQAFARVVDRLLASPHYGERWGRYWLDVARYGEDDSHGFGGSHVNAFRYRDWVIQAFNDDMPYDLFVKAQIAADLLEGKDREKLMAGLGFFGIGPRFQVVEPIKAKAEECNDRVDTLTRGFLGLTVACARCHDHKYDPITVKDYYGMTGVFASSEYREFPLVRENIVKEWQEQEKRIKDQEGAIKEFIQIQSTQLSEILASKTAKYMVSAWQVLASPKENRERTARENQLDLETLERWVKYLTAKEREHPYLQAWDALTQPATIEAVKTVAGEFQNLVISILKEKKIVDEKNRTTLAQAKDEGYCKECFVSLLSLERDKFVLWRDLFDEKRRKDDQTWTDGGVLLYQDDKIDRFLSGDWRSHLAWMRTELDALKKALPPQYPYLHTIAESPKPANLRIHIRGNPENLGEEAPRRFLAVLSDGKPVQFAKGSGRLELAEAIANQPLTARVMVNRIWQHHFGRGIVGTPSNFGQLGEQPSQPELLDYLASRFIENHWSIKALHREIMLSATYQLSSDYSKENFAVDPDNRLLWRANRRRLDAEALIDSILFVSGNLDLTVGGPSVELSKDCRRRTVYAKISRHKRDVLLGMFDFPDPSISSEKRNVTIVPLQQLFFLNSELMLLQAETLAKRLQEDTSTDTVKIQKAYRLLFGREATRREVSVGLDFFRESQTESTSRSLAWQHYTQALLTSNEFSFVD